MDVKIDLFSQAIRFSPFWMSIDLLLIMHFIFSWYRNWKKTKWKIDFWYFTLFYNFFVIVLLMYPFNGSIYNVKAVGMSFFSQMDGYIEQAFCITIIGYLSIWIGRYVFDFTKDQLPIFSVFKLFTPLARLIENNLRSARAGLFLFLLSITLLSFVLVLQSAELQFFNPRKFFLENDSLRPIFNLTLTIFQVSIPFLGIRYLQYKDKLSKYLLVLIFTLSIFLGIRGIVVLNMLSIILFGIFKKKGNFNVSKLFIQCLALIFLGILIDCLRHGQFNPILSMTHFLIEFFYGNHFSDTRDFGLILSSWDQNYVYGKTYIAGFLSFIPRFLSDFRQDWSLSVYTNSLVGLDIKEHAGLRPGLFGEVFLNFGYLGVISLGILAGYVLRYVDLKIKEAVNQDADIIKGYSKSALYFFVSCLFMTPGFWGVYVLILINLVLYVVNRIRFSYV